MLGLWNKIIDYVKGLIKVIIGIFKKFTHYYWVTLIVAGIFLYLANKYNDSLFSATAGGIAGSILASLMYDVIKEEIQH